ncbi:MAG: hypothetical protein SFU56_16325 [Capsulimonadales bacterium]|nr:hypothetical protein [Capsulimonadales bacterium]
MSDPRDLLKPVGLQPIGGKTEKGGKIEKEETPPAPTPPADAYLRTAAPSTDNTPPDPARNLRRVIEEEEAQDNGPRVRAMLFGGGALLAVIVLAAYVVSQLPRPASDVREYQPFSAADHSFTCETPKGWEAKATGEAAGVPLSSQENGLILRSGSARMEITMSTVAGLAHGQLLFGGEITPGAMTGKGNAGTVARLQRKGIAGRYIHYRETQQKDVDSEMASTEGLKELAAMGAAANIRVDMEPDVRLYEFTASEPWYRLGGKVHGFRGVFGGGAYIASVVCHCPEAEWSKVKPVFLRVMKSIREEPPAEGEAEEVPQVPTTEFTPAPGG